MQIQAQILMKKEGSLRAKIVEDLAKDKNLDGLYLEKSKDMHRNPGWAKVGARDIPGMLNIQWFPNQTLLAVRAIAEQGNSPYELLGLFTKYVMKKYGWQISGINIQLE